MKRVCAGIIHRDEHTAELVRPIEDYVADVLETPLADALESVGIGETMRRLKPAKRRWNDVPTVDRRTALAVAIAAGVVTFADEDGMGVFRGSFNAAISRELQDYGAKFSKLRGAWRIDRTRIPFTIRHEISVAAGKSKETHEELAALLLLIAGAVALPDRQVSTGIDVAMSAMVIDQSLVYQLKKTLPGEKGELVPNVRLRVEDVAEMKMAVDTAVKKNVAQAAKELADAVKANAESGGNIPRLLEIVDVHMARLRRKNKSVAEHATAIFIAKEREKFYTSIGVGSYVWQTRLDERVRVDHRVLEGSRFSWDSPPITNRATGARNHPGEDYGCRCVPLPVIYVNDDE